MTEMCAFCGNKNLSKKLTRYIHQRGENLLIVEDAPCLECDFCGEQYFDAFVLKTIEDDHLAIIKHQKLPSRIQTVAVENFASLSS
ncbi:MAG: type II toxin-antitoxin system MqsA family antitoxin [Methylomonas sp.]|jgi:YgiT-type zinc finger domain-containing protein